MDANILGSSQLRNRPLTPGSQQCLRSKVQTPTAARLLWLFIPRSDRLHPSLPLSRMPPQAFHNFVFRRHRRDALKHSSSLSSSRESSGTESLTCASQGDATGASGARRGLAGGAGGNGGPDVVESLSSRSRREWEFAQGRRVR